MTPCPNPPIITPAGAAVRAYDLHLYRSGRARDVTTRQPCVILSLRRDDDWTPPGGASAIAVPASAMIEARAA